MSVRECVRVLCIQIHFVPKVNAKLEEEADRRASSTSHLRKVGDRGRVEKAEEGGENGGGKAKFVINA